MTTTTKVETLNKALMIAVETNNMPLMNLAFSMGDTRPTNIRECAFLAIEKNQMDQVDFLTKKIDNIVAVAVAAVTKTRPLTISEVKVDMSDSTMNTKNNSQVLCDFAYDKHKAHRELDDGIISLEEINHQNDSGWNLFMFASLWPDEAFLTKLLKMDGVLSNLTNNLGQTALMICLQEHCKHGGRNRLNSVELLLKDPKIEVNHVSFSGYSALRYAHQNLTMMDMLLAHPKINVNVEHPNKYTILHLVCVHVHVFEHSIKILEMLLKHPDIDVNAKTVDGFTPLMLLCASIKGAHVPPMIEMLLKHPKIDVKMINKAGHNALELSCPQYKTVELLIKATNPVKN